MARYGGVEGSYGGYGSLLGTVNLTGTASTGFPVLLAQSAVAVAAPADTNANTILTVAVPANTLTANGRIRGRIAFSCTSSANNKTFTLRYGGSVIFSTVETTQARASIIFEMANRNATNSQITVSQFSGSAAATEKAPTTSAVDSTAAQNFIVEVTKASAGETIQMESYCLEYIKAAS
jgi:hypothetical protein